MGSPLDEPGRQRIEDIPHRVVISQPFWIGQFEVTREQWQRLENGKTSGIDSDVWTPMNVVSWEQAQRFCQKLTIHEAKARRLPAGYAYRLPTEEEWEYACRAGTTTATAFGDSLSSHQANFQGNEPYGDAPIGPFRESVTPVGSFKPNAWGLHDMHGNVAEWCIPAPDGYRFARGGCWHYYGKNCRSAHRAGFGDEGWPSQFVGFRVCLGPEPRTNRDRDP